MKKMPTPELEIIPFNTEDDVIVTSGIAGIPVENNRWYATAGSELREADIYSYGSSNSKEVDDKIVYLLQFSGGNVNKVSTKWSDISEDEVTYAWHIDSGWLTGALPVKSNGENVPNLILFQETYTN